MPNTHQTWYKHACTVYTVADLNFTNGRNVQLQSKSRLFAEESRSSLHFQALLIPFDQNLMSNATAEIHVYAQRVTIRDGTATSSFTFNRIQQRQNIPNTYLQWTWRETKNRARLVATSRIWFQSILNLPFLVLDRRGSITGRKCGISTWKRHGVGTR